MNCRLLANLPTCLLAYLPTCELAHYTDYAFSEGVSSLVSFLLVPFPRSARSFRPASRIARRDEDTRGGAVFLIRPSHPLGPYPSRSAPFSLAHSFLHLIMPSRPIVSSGVSPDVIPSVVLFITGSMGTRYGNMGHGFLFNIIFLYLTFAMLKTKK